MSDWEMDNWAAWPWKTVDETVFSRMPTYAFAEVVYIALGFFCLLHAVAQPGAARQKHMLLFLCAMFGGLANDIIFMFMPLTENFWHGQATLMLTPRLPLYILIVYLSFLGKNKTRHRGAHGLDKEHETCCQNHPAPT